VDTHQKRNERWVSTFSIRRLSNCRADRASLSSKNDTWLYCPQRIPDIVIGKSDRFLIAGVVLRIVEGAVQAGPG
jgi:hypothetical protein